MKLALLGLALAAITMACAGENDINITGYSPPPGIYATHYNFTQWGVDGKLAFVITNATGWVTVGRSQGGSYILANTWPADSGVERLNINTTGVDNGWTLGFGQYRVETVGDLTIEQGGAISDSYWATSSDSISLGSDLYAIGPLTRLQ